MNCRLIRSPKLVHVTSLAALFRILLLLHIPSHGLSAPNINHQIKIERDLFCVGWPIADIPIPHLIWTIGPQPGNWFWLLGKPGSMGLNLFFHNRLCSRLRQLFLLAAQLLFELGAIGPGADLGAAFRQAPA